MSGQHDDHNECQQQDNEYDNECDASDYKNQAGPVTYCNSSEKDRGESTRYDDEIWSEDSSVHSSDEEFETSGSESEEEGTFDRPLLAVHQQTPFWQKLFRN